MNICLQMNIRILLLSILCVLKCRYTNDSNGEGKAGDPACGDSLNIYIKVKDDLIEDISF